MLPFSLFLPTLQIFFLLSAKTYSQSSPLLTVCTNGTYDPSSHYASILRRLVTDLTASVPHSPTLFSTASAGNSSSPAFALAQCRPDASSDLCSSCILLAATESLGAGCGLNNSAAIRYDYCLLRYSDVNFFGYPMSTPIWRRNNIQNASQPAEFGAKVEYLLQSISMSAAASDSRFAANSSEMREIYGMAWCTRDLSSGDCLDCLRQAISVLGKESVGAQAESVSCAVRFETHLFFSQSFTPSPHLYKEESTSESIKCTKRIVIAVPTAAVAFLLISAAFILLMMRTWKKSLKLSTRNGDASEEEMNNSVASLLIDLPTIKAATNNFSEANMLGEGGFGPVYKGVLGNGQEIAVKRLAKASGQGLVEMRNEVVFLAKLQHKNLVRLVGCCAEGKEKLLVYEYLPNRSLDKLLFEQELRVQLGWATRLKIIEGICRGLLYLHEDSRFRIIHRDLKASNILLDADMNPKISDFGLAKMSGIHECQGTTSRISGTYGYMSPEYAFRGFFSTKSDVFSYGVLILEIVTGRSSSCFLGSSNNLDLLSYVWQYWNQGMALQVVDQSLGGRYPAEEAMRCIQIGLLCVQEDPAERPSVASLVVMLNSHSAELPVPSMPQFLLTLQVIAHSSEIDLARSDRSDLRADLSTSDFMSSFSESMRPLSPVSV
ncbi:hypothetical protein HPP92_001564 [Vanilla planifolia]|uniref:Cysteine-rich receptor-like protein kinase 10 n=1 Tax=Vanilla planifolia TaxID=51239 RepID=A0A835SC65_VANPL|nr:hypothetical protein HPP92_001564 [Vanilla planifolia]